MSIVSAAIRTIRHVASHVVYMQIDRPQGFLWTTGQCASIGLSIDGEEVFRAYSIASPGNSQTVDFIIGEVAGGTLSPRLTALHEGDCVLFNTEAFGSLYESKFQPGGKDLWLFASGTGISPFLAFVRDEAVMAKYDRVFLVHTVRTWEETNYVSQFLQGRNKVRFITDVTRQEGAVLHERIPLALADGSLEKAAGAPLQTDTSRVMLCGSPVVVEAIRDALKPRGFVTPRRTRPGQLLAENF